MNHFKAIRWIFGLLAIAHLAACGFHLRQPVALPEELTPMYVQAGLRSNVREAILERLAGSGTEVAPGPRAAKLIVRIKREGRNSRVAAVDIDRKILARELRLTVVYDAVDAKGNELVSKQELVLTRTYDNPDVQVLGKELEREIIYSDLTRDAADRILDRLRILLAK